jgi:asparagine synthetase A
MEKLKTVSDITAPAAFEMTERAVTASFNHSHFLPDFTFLLQGEESISNIPQDSNKNPNAIKAG